MNCKPGDLAVFVRSAAGNVGKIVRCLRLATSAEIEAKNHIPDMGPVWIIDRELPRQRTPAALALDCILRPIRPQPDDAVDEVIQRIGTPHKETA
jgi:hypothetical protein